MNTIIEPFRIKVTEPIHIISAEERAQKLKQAHWNVFLLDAEDCAIDLLTDSGTGAMSTHQWAAMMMGDESYAGSRSWKRFRDVVQDISGMPFVFPTHQGRAAEGILAECIVKSGMIVPNNSHFDTTRANLEYVGADARNMPCTESMDTAAQYPFKGNMDLNLLRETLEQHAAEIPFVMITVTNNTGGGQPVSMANIRSVRALCDEFEKPLVIDACRFAENAWFVKQREQGFADKSLTEIAQEMFAMADAATMSLKKDGLANIGGFLVCRNEEWADSFRNLLILREGFPTYGGLAGRDLEAIAVGLREALEEEYQRYRHATVQYFAKQLDAAGIPYMSPAGGHAIFLDAKKFLPHIDSLQYPGISLVNALYLEGGIRAVELGSVMFGSFDKDGREIPSPLELVRLAFPRRVYTQSHFDYVLEVLKRVYDQRSTLQGYNITKQPPFLRHFTCEFEPV